MIVIHDPTVVNNKTVRIETLTDNPDVLYYVPSLKQSNVKEVKTKILSMSNITQLEVKSYGLSPLRRDIGRDEYNMMDVIEILRDLVHVTLRGEFSGWFYGTIFYVLSIQKSLQSLVWKHVGRFPREEGEDEGSFRALTKSNSLKRLVFSALDMKLYVQLGFISFMIKKVPSLKLPERFPTSELNKIFTQLSKNETVLEILEINLIGDLTRLGMALKTNTTLKCLDFLQDPESSFKSIYEGMVHNSSILKLVGYVHEGDEQSFIRMLRVNTMLETLEITMHPLIDDVEGLVSALSQSSLVSFTIYLPGERDTMVFATKLFHELATNTTLKHLEIHSEAGFSLDANVIVDLLSRNETLETFIVDNSSIYNEEELSAVRNNTVTKVWSGSPSILRTMADQNQWMKSQ